MSDKQETIDALKRMKVLLTDERAWCRRASALDQDQVPVNATDVRACKWCLWGAIVKSTFAERMAAGLQTNIHLALRKAAFNIVVSERGIKKLNGDLISPEATGVDIVHFNDDRRTTHADVLEVIDKAIKITEENALFENAVKT